MKANFKFTTILTITVLIGLFFAVGCTSTANEIVENEPVQIEETNIDPVVDNTANDAVVEDIIIVDEEGATSIDLTALDGTLAPGITGELSEIEIEGLVFMREEEKLAQDVYLYLADMWGLQIFSNIARSESTHTEAIRSLLEKYGIEDPSISAELGEFTDPILQDLYDQLIAAGSQSLEDAILVGIAIEEIDILDLEKYIANTDNSDIILVYESLLKGSRNHLRAFVSNLENQTGEIYEPQYLDQDAYETIINASTERGGPGNGN